MPGNRGKAQDVFRSKPGIMKSGMLLILKIIGITLAVLLVAVAYIVFLTGPKLPREAQPVIDEVLHSALPDFVKGQTGYVVSDGYRIWYEAITPEDTVKGTVLLFMGISNDALGWPQDFIDEIVGSGYRVIRFDYRGTGLSDWKKGRDARPILSAISPTMRSSSSIHFRSAKPISSGYPSVEWSPRNMPSITLNGH